MDLIYPTDLITQDIDIIQDPYVQFIPIKYTYGSKMNNGFPQKIIEKKVSEDVKDGSNLIDSIVLPLGENKVKDQTKFNWKMSAGIRGAIAQKLDSVIGLGTAIKEQIAISSGLTYGQYEAMIFDGISGVRDFPYELTFYPRNPDEAKLARTIANLFYIISMPLLTKGAGNAIVSGSADSVLQSSKNLISGVSLTSLSQFKDTIISGAMNILGLQEFQSPPCWNLFIEYPNNRRPILFKNMVIDSISITEGATDSSKVPIFKDGQSVFTLSLNFLETDLLTKNDFFAPPDGN